MVAMGEPLRLLLGAGPPPADGSAMDGLRLLGAAVVVVGFGLFATTALFSRLQRNRLFAALIAGGWPAVLVGWLIGPGGLRLVNDETLLLLRPLFDACIGWVGVIVGMQLRRTALRHVPAALWRWAAVDALVTGLCAALLAAAVLYWWFEPGARTAAWLIIPAALIGCATMGWSPETRSIRAELDPDTRHLSLLIQGGSGISAVIAILVFGVVSQMVAIQPNGVPVIDPGLVLLDLLLAIATATALGMGARHLLHLAGRKRGALLVMFLGTVAGTAGIAVSIGFSPLLLPMLCGIAIVNLGQERLPSFELFIMRAEHVIALLLFLVAGLLLTPGAGTAALLIALTTILTRIVLKPRLARRALRPLAREGALRTPLRLAPLRQAQLALVLGVSVVLLYDSTVTRAMLTALVFAGVASDIIPLVLGYRFHRELANGRRLRTRAAA